MDKGQRLAGLSGQVLIIISAIVTIILSLVMFFPIPPDSHVLFSIIKTPPFGLLIIDFYYDHRHIYWDGICGCGFWYPQEFWSNLTSGSSLTGILNSSIFFISIILVIISIYRTARGSDENFGTTAKAKSLFKAALAFAFIAYLLSILSHGLSLGMYTYSYEHVGFLAGFPKTASITHIYLNGFGWSLLILQNTFGVLMMILVGLFFKVIASRIQKSSLQTRKLWFTIGKTYIMLGGMTAFTIFVALIEVNMTFLVPIMVILSGVVGAAGFIKFRPTMFLVMIGMTGSMRNTMGAITGAIYGMEVLAKEIELESYTNEGSRFIIISEMKCLDCRYKNPIGAEFCVGCGQRLN